MTKAALEHPLLKVHPRLQNCLRSDPDHVKFGDKGDYVVAIQLALMTVDGADIDPIELKDKTFGVSTRQAVVTYKSNPKRKIINFLYEQSVDPIVGKMTIEKLDDDLLGRKASVDPMIDPNEPTRIAQVLARERPGVARIIDRTIALLTELRDALALREEEPGKLMQFELASPMMMDALRRFCGMGFLEDRNLVKTLLGQYIAFKTQLPNLPRDQKGLTFSAFVAKFPDNLTIKPDGPDFPPAVTDFDEGMFFSPRYRDIDMTQTPLFRGLAPAILELIQLHEMGHFYFRFADGDPRGKPFQISRNFAQTYEFFTRQAVFRLPVPAADS